MRRQDKDRLFLEQNSISFFKSDNQIKTNITHEGALNGTESKLESKGQQSRRLTLYIRHVVDVSPPLIREEGEEKWEGEERMGEGKGQTALLLIGRNAAIKDYVPSVDECGGVLIQQHAAARVCIPWSGGGERIYAAVGGACLLQRAGELSVVEYGLDRVLQTVSIDQDLHNVNVRINEGRKTEEERKHFAYLLTDRRLLLLILLQLGPWWHEARVDWLELTESGHLLLFRHTRRRLALLRIDTGEKEIIGSGVSFVQWIENSVAVVAQTSTHLLICIPWIHRAGAGSIALQGEELQQCLGLATQV
ncbi:unnamed protein product [Danaus chrysippus]|uniref:(African queen) hypothetical protein n=1 Tax=Danaus chrysippus TaxID=151541 RepID=A0A8J2VU22_9NEOP|nr:unnamed protein product [Danaus chrysippus]